jgi:proteasome accessory factor B
VVGEVTTVGKPGVVQRPPGINLLDYVLGGQQQDTRPTTTARVWVADGRAQGVRRQADRVGGRDLDGQPGDEMTIELRSPESAAGWLAGHGEDVVVLEPDVLRKAVQERLLGALDAQLAVTGGESWGR